MKKFFVFFSLVLFSLSAIPVQLNAETTDKKAAPVIRKAPPAPKFSDAERQAELARRRQAVFNAMADNSMMILFSADPKLYTNDVNYVYRQENNLYYLTNLKQNNATLVLIKNGGGTQEILFLPKRNPQTETWNGKMYSNEDAMRVSGLKTIINAAETKDFVQAVKEKKSFASKDGANISASVENLYLALPGGAFDGNGMREYGKEFKLAEGVAKVSVNEKTKQYEFAPTVGYKINNASPIFAELRHVKTPYELKLMQHAIDITTEAQMRSMAMVGRAKMEYEVQAEVEYTFRRRNADFWGYPSIVGCGPNATTLHYEEAQGAINQGDLLLMDVGAEYDHYTADVTRTFPVNGKFSKEQAEIYQIVYEAQEAAARATKPGATFDQVGDAADEVIKNGLAKLGLITAPNASYEVVFQGKTIQMPQYRIWFMHGLGHWLGMNVHDVGNYGAPLKPGMIYTNEPGIYLREDALDYMPDTPANKEFLSKVRPVFERYKNIGVRIEDDMLVTENGVEWMTKALPRKLSEIEAFMAKASKEMPYSANLLEKPESIFFSQNAGIFENDFALINSFDRQSGSTVRRGWVYAGKNAAYSGLNHSDHAHGE